MYYCQRKPKNRKNGRGRLGNEAIVIQYYTIRKIRVLPNSHTEVCKVVSTAILIFGAVATKAQRS